MRKISEATTDEIYQLAMAATGKKFEELTDDDILQYGIGMDNAIQRSKNPSKKDDDRLKKNVWLVQRKYGLSDEEKDLEMAAAEVRRLAGLNEAAMAYTIRVNLGGRTIETVVWAENRVEAALIAKQQFGHLVSAPTKR